MAKFCFELRGEGFAEHVETEFFRVSNLVDLLNRTPEPLLEAAQFGRLLTFIGKDVPVDRWTSEHRHEGLALAALVRASERDALVPEAKGVVCAYLEGKLKRRAGRPKKIFSLSGRDLPMLAKFIKQHVEICIQKGQPLVIPQLGEVCEEPEWQRLPTSERAMRIAHKALSDWGLNPPAVATLRNKLPKFSTLGIIS